MIDAELEQALHEDVLTASKLLLGTVLCRDSRRARIVETEAYRAEDDPGSHAHRGKTPRNAIMFGEPGFAYVYFNYGVHWMLNVTAHQKGRAAGILIRAAQPLEGLGEMRELRGGLEDRQLLSGPGKLTKAFEITGADNGVALFDPASDLRIEPGERARVVATTRIGLAEGKGHELPWRFVDADRLEWISRPTPKPT